MTARPYLRTSDLALAGVISMQQVRNYEASGLIPQAQRSPGGYRLYTQQHLAALKRVKSMVPRYGWPPTSAIIQALHRGDLSTALAIIDERHAEQARIRLQMEQTLSALRLLASESVSKPRTSHPQRVRVGEAAKQVGVRVSALHFWEQQGLLHPVREQYSRYRLYDEHQMRRLRVVALLREMEIAAGTAVEFQSPIYQGNICLPPITQWIYNRSNQVVFSQTDAFSWAGDATSSGLVSSKSMA